MHAAESRPALRRSAPPATPSSQPPASPPTACFHAPDPHRRSASPPVASRLCSPSASASPAQLRLHEPPRLRGQRPAARTRNNQPRAMQSCLERIKEEGRGGGDFRSPRGFPSGCGVGVQDRSCFRRGGGGEFWLRGFLSAFPLKQKRVE